MKTTTPSEGLAMCDAGCGRQLKSSEGQRRRIADRDIHICYGVRCVTWADRLERAS